MHIPRERQQPPDDVALSDWFRAYGTSRQVVPGSLSARTLPDGFVFVRSGLLLLEHYLDKTNPIPCFATLIFGGELFATSSFQYLPPLRFSALLTSTLYTVTSDAVTQNATPAVQGLITSKSVAIATRLSRQAMAILAANAEQRFLMLMVKLGARLGTARGNTVNIKLPMTRPQMAEFLGLTPETVSRAITQAKTDGLVSFTGRRDVTILDWERLVHAAPLGDYILAANRPAAVA